MNGEEDAGSVGWDRGAEKGWACGGVAVLAKGFVDWRETGEVRVEGDVIAVPVGLKPIEEAEDTVVPVGIMDWRKGLVLVGDVTMGLPVNVACCWGCCWKLATPA